MALLEMEMLRKPGILLIDDTAEFIELYKLQLEASGKYSVLATATNGRSGIIEASAWRPDIIILDLSMPIMDGMEALPLLRKASPKSKIIVVSAYLEGQFKNVVKSHSADGYLEKGHSTAQLLEVIDSLIV